MTGSHEEWLEEAPPTAAEQTDKRWTAILYVLFGMVVFVIFLAAPGLVLGLVFGLVFGLGPIIALLVIPFILLSWWKSSDSLMRREMAELREELRRSRSVAATSTQPEKEESLEIKEVTEDFLRKVQIPQPN